MTGLQAIADAEDAARRIAALEARNPDIMIWPPDGSVSGEWEALGDDWLITDRDPCQFYGRVVRTLGGTADDPAAGAAVPPLPTVAEDAVHQENPRACVTIPAFYTVAELAELLRVSRNAIYRLIRAGTVSADRTVPGRPYRIDGASVQAYLAASRPGPAPLAMEGKMTDEDTAPFPADSVSVPGASRPARPSASGGVSLARPGNPPGPRADAALQGGPGTIRHAWEEPRQLRG